MAQCHSHTCWNSACLPTLAQTSATWMLTWRDNAFSSNTTKYYERHESSLTDCKQPVRHDRPEPPKHASTAERRLCECFGTWLCLDRLALGLFHCNCQPTPYILPNSITVGSIEQQSAGHLRVQGSCSAALLLAGINEPTEIGTQGCACLTEADAACDGLRRPRPT